MSDYRGDDAVREVRARIDIVSLIGEYVSLKKRGRNYVGLCPFHSEKTPSFTVSPDKQMFYCFGCQTGGDVFAFVMKKENVEFAEALTLLADRAGIRLTRRGEDGQHRREKESQRQVLEYALMYFIAALHSSAGKQALDYCARRGIDAHTRDLFQIGYAPGGWETLIRALLKKGFDASQVYAAGLAVARDNGRGYYDRFRNRLMFPIWNPRGQLVGFGGRSLDGSEPKYLNTPDTALFSKGNVLYGLHIAREHIKLKDKVILVEGYMDTITCHQYGFGNTVASLGTALTKAQARLIAQFTKNVVLGYDTDTAGQNATERGMELLSEEGLRVYVAAFPGGKDPDDCIRTQGKEVFERAVNEAPSLTDYRIEKALGGFDLNTLEGKLKALANIIPILRGMTSRVEQDLYIKRIGERLKVTEYALRQEIFRARDKMSGGRNNIEDLKKAEKIVHLSDSEGMRKAETEILRALISKPEIIGRFQGVLDAELFEHDDLKEILEKILEVYDMHRELPSYILAEGLSEVAASSLGRLATEDYQYVDYEKAVSDCIRRIEYFKTSRRLKQIEESIKACTTRGEAVGEEVLREYYQLLRRMKVPKSTSDDA